MNERLIITNAKHIDNNQFLLEVDKSNKLAGLTASGQMLVDSSGLSFIYLLENEEGYTYISIPESFWNNLKEVLDENLSVLVTNGEDQIKLFQFTEELNYLIENIKGNSNYGEEMVKKVEVVFA